MSLECNIDNLYEKNPKLKKEDVEKLREWGLKQPHLPEPTEFMLILFLHSCYYSLEQAKRTMDNYFTTRTLCPEFFHYNGLEIIKRNAIVAYTGVLPDKTPEKYSVIFGKLLDYDSDKYNFYQQCLFLEMMTFIYHLQNGVPEGCVVVLDGKGISFGHLTKFHPVALKKYAYYIQEAAPLRIKGIHVINANSIVEKVLNIAKAFINSELINIIYVHKSIDNLYKFVPKNILPKDYGGDGPLIQDLQAENIRFVEKHDNEFYFYNTLTVDESKRPGKPKTAGDLFGTDGTFKKLELD